LQPVSGLSDWALRNQAKIARARDQFDSAAARAATPARREARHGGLVAAASRN
jgi:hypothetical protein